MKGERKGGKVAQRFLRTFWDFLGSPVVNLDAWPHSSPIIQNPNKNFSTKSIGRGTSKQANGMFEVACLTTCKRLPIP